MMQELKEIFYPIRMTFFKIKKVKMSYLKATRRKRKGVFKRHKRYEVKHALKEIRNLRKGSE